MALGPLPDAAQIIQATMLGTKNSYPWVNVLYLQYSGTAPDVSALNSVATSIGNAWNTNFASLADTTVIMNEVKLIDLTNRGSAISDVTGMNHPGTRAGTNLTNQVAAVVSWRINHRYRGGHPRSYMPFGVLGDVTTGRTWTTTFTGLVTTGAGAFRTALNAITWSGATVKMVSMNFYSHDPATGEKTYVIPPVPYTIQSAVCHGRVDTQRRRLGKETP